jgi:ATPase subunit of ABC transporter with duplicated ATPase domains
MITLSGLGKSYGARSLFSGVSLQLNPGERYGLVGANGSGKTTLLKILIGDEPASDGEVNTARGTKVGVLRQDQFIDDQERIIDVAMAGDAEAARALRELDQLATETAPDPNRLGDLNDILMAHDGYTLEARASEILVGLGVAQSVLQEPLGTLSGGFKLRVLLARVLVGAPGALLLDEPTNHLDILSIRWLEVFLQSYKGCAVVISHDRRFLDRTATRILDVDYGAVIQYKGNYTAFLEQKATTRDRKEAEIARVEKTIAEKKAFVERFRAKATKARQAQSRVKQLDRIEVEELAPSSRRAPNFIFETRRHSGRDVVALRDLHKSFGDNHVLHGVSAAFRRGERIAIIGANGIGKSTLIKILAGRLEPDSGDTEWGHETHVGYFAQDHSDVLEHGNSTPLSYVWEACPADTTNYVRGHLGRMLFSRDDVDKPVSTLSGGEAARVMFARLAVEKPNVLLLDEPTNHLDMETIEALTEALGQYEGTLVFVSHDRHFVAQLATRVIEVRRDGVTDYPGTYDEYLSRDGTDHLSEEAVVSEAKRDKIRVKSGSISREKQTPPRLPEAGSLGAPPRSRSQLRGRTRRAPTGEPPAEAKALEQSAEPTPERPTIRRGRRH